MNTNKSNIVVFLLFLLSAVAVGQHSFQNSSFVKHDTLKIVYKEILSNDSYKTNKLSWNKKRVLGTVLMVSCGVLSYYCHEQAESYYSRYLHSGSIEQMNKHFDRAEKYDRYKGIASIGVEIGFLLNVWSFL